MSEADHEQLVNALALLFYALLFAALVGFGWWIRGKRE